MNLEIKETHESKTCPINKLDVGCWFVFDQRLMVISSCAISEVRALTFDSINGTTQYTLNDTTIVQPVDIVSLKIEYTK